MATVKLSFDLENEDEAWALAEFVKRVGWTDIRQNAVSDEEAYVMRNAIHKLQESLAETGYAPR